MKKNTLGRIALTLSLLLLLGSLAACAEAPAESAAGDPTSDQQSQAEPSAPSETEADFPGQYPVPEGWVQAEKYSTDEKRFYVEEGHQEDPQPDNISIEVGTNRYSAEDHEQFRDAILRQLAMQLQGVDAQLTGDGTYTEEGDILYIFTISEADVVTKQYYIVGDQQYCLLQLTNFTGSEAANEAAQSMATHFVWN